MLAALIVDGLAQGRKNLTPTSYDVGDPVWALYGVDDDEGETEHKSPKSAEGQFRSSSSRSGAHGARTRA